MFWIFRQGLRRAADNQPERDRRGVMFDIYDDFCKDVNAFIPYMREKLKEYDDFFLA